MNVFIAYGRLTGDVKLQYSESRLAVGKFSLAVSRAYTGGDKKADFFNMTAFGKTAENIEKFFKKGSRIVVQCHAQQEEYEKNGQKINTVGFIVDRFSFVDTKAENGITQSQNTQPVPPKAPESSDFMQIPDDMDELPFD